jgi:hypothetical protein
MYTFTIYNKIPTITEWAQQTLAPEELVQFTSAYHENQALYDDYEKRGLCKTTKLYHNQVNLPGYDVPLKVEIGVTLEVFDTEQVKNSPSYIPWEERYHREVT